MSSDLRSVLDEIVQEVARLKTGRTNRVPSVYRPESTDVMLLAEARSALDMLRKRNEASSKRKRDHARAGIKRAMR